jgi:hypothetical protein
MGTLIEEAKGQNKRNEVSLLRVAFGEGNMV